jgi:hypothetical protein
MNKDRFGWKEWALSMLFGASIGVAAVALGGWVGHYLSFNNEAYLYNTLALGLMLYGAFILAIVSDTFGWLKSALRAIGMATERLAARAEQRRKR